MEVTLEAIAGEISRQLGEFEQRFVSVVETAKNELIEQAKSHHQSLTEQAEGHHESLTELAKIHREALRKDFKDGLDGYGGTLERIERELVELRTEIKKDLGNHDLVLSNHNERIVALEKHR